MIFPNITYFQVIQMKAYQILMLCPNQAEDTLECVCVQVCVCVWRLFQNILHKVRHVAF